MPVLPVAACASSPATTSILVAPGRQFFTHASSTCSFLPSNYALQASGMVRCLAIFSKDITSPCDVLAALTIWLATPYLSYVGGAGVHVSPGGPHNLQFHATAAVSVEAHTPAGCSGSRRALRSMLACASACSHGVSMGALSA